MGFVFYVTSYDIRKVCGRAPKGYTACTDTKILTRLESGCGKFSVITAKQPSALIQIKDVMKKNHFILLKKEKREKKSQLK